MPIIGSPKRVLYPIKGCLYYDTCATYMCAAHVRLYAAHVRRACVTYRMFPTTHNVRRTCMGVASGPLHFAK